MTFSASSLRLFPVAAVMAVGGSLSAPALAEVYDRVVVRGAQYIPQDDISLTCGDLVGIELDALQRKAVEECLMTTGVFESVRVHGEGDALVIDVQEIETRPGRIDMGVAWDNDYGLSATLNYEQFNIFPDTYLTIRNSYTRDHRSYEISIFREKISGPDLHFGLEIRGERTKPDDRRYATRGDLIEAFGVWTPAGAYRLEFGGGYRDHRMFDVNSDASPILHREAGAVGAPFAHLALGYKSGTDAGPFGLSLRVDQYFWNLGSEARVNETRIDLKARFALGETSDLMLGLHGGRVSGRGGYAPRAMDRGALGGDSFRGFAPRGLGPSDLGDRLGGNNWLVASVEVQRDLGTAMERKFRGGVFVDVGSVWSLSDTLDGRIDDDAKWRSSIGLSLSTKLAEVPVSLYVARPIRSFEGDRKQVFGLSATARF